MLHISLSPNVEKDDILLSLRALSPLRWKDKSYINKLRDQLQNYFDGSSVYPTNSGRTALFCILSGLNIDKNDEVIIQSFTCNAVVNPILWCGAKPIYADIDKHTYNLDVNSVKEKITSKTRAVVFQHSFGISSGYIYELKTICKEKNIVLIEDCAHALGLKCKGKKAGLIGDIAFLSFGRDKVISCVYGGAIVTKKYEDKIKIEYDKYSYPSIFWTLQQVIHPIVTKFLLKIYSYGGSKFLWLFQKMLILSRAVSYDEKQGRRPSHFPKKLPNQLAMLALNQFSKLEKFNNHRILLASIYRDGLKKVEGIELPRAEEGSIFLRYPVRYTYSSHVFRKGYSQKIILGDWYRSVIDPADTNIDKMLYKKDNPESEQAALDVINLPTHINTKESDARRIISLISRS